MALSGTVSAILNLVKTNALDLKTARTAIQAEPSVTFADGVGANQINREWDDSRSLAGGANESLDLAGAALVDEFGTTIVFARVKLLYVKNTSATASIGVGNNVANAMATLLSDEVILPPGGFLLVVAPNAAGAVVTAGTGDLLNIANKDGSNAATYDIFIAGGAT